MYYIKLFIFVYYIVLKDIQTHIHVHSLISSLKKIFKQCKLSCPHILLIIVKRESQKMRQLGKYVNWGHSDSHTYICSLTHSDRQTNMSNTWDHKSIMYWFVYSNLSYHGRINWTLVAVKTVSQSSCINCCVTVSLESC